MQDEKTISGSIVHITDGAEADARAIVVEIEPVQSGSGTPSPSNVRPITGWDDVSVTVDSKYGGTINWNQILRDPLLTMDWNVSGRYSDVVLADNIATATPTSAGDSRGCQFRIDGVFTGHKYLAIAEVKSTAIGNISVGMNGGFKQLRPITPNTWTVIGAIWAPTQDYATAWATFYQDNSITTSDRIQYKTPQCFDLTQMFGEEKADEIYAMEQAQEGAGVAWFKALFPHSYYDYDDGTETCVSAVNGDPYSQATTTLPSTTYGGTIDLVSGVLTVDRAIVDLGTLTWTVSTNDRFYAAMPSGSITPTSSGDTEALCSAYDRFLAETTSINSQPDGTFFVNSTKFSSVKRVVIKDSSKSSMSAADFKTAMNGVQVVYELATPTTAQLTGQQIELLRDCFVWADAGDITLTYETELLDGRFHKIKVNDNSIIAPNNFELEREDVYTAEYTTCTGKLIADKIGWKYADTTMQWDTLPDDMLAILTGTTGAFTLKFTDSDGSHTENVIRLGVRNTATRFTDDFGNALWRNIELEVSFTNVH